MGQERFDERLTRPRQNWGGGEPPERLDAADAVAPELRQVIAAPPSAGRAAPNGN